MTGTSSPHRRTYRLPFGGAVTFDWRPPDGFTRIFDATPSGLSSRQRRKLMAAYAAARTDFLRDLATMLGGPVVVLDEVGVYVSQPGTRQ